MGCKKEYIEKLKEVAPHIKKHYQVKSLLLFGSLSRGDNTEESDIDLLVDMPPKIFQLMSLHELLEEKLGVKVDLVRKHSRLSQFFLNEINRDGIRIL